MPIFYGPSLPPVPAGLTLETLSIMREQLEEDTVQSILSAIQGLSRQSDGLDIREYGARVDGVHDDTLFIQEALDDASSVPGNGKRVIIPGLSVISDTLLIDSVQGAGMVGRGMYESGFIWNGPGGQPMIRIRNSQYITVKDLQLQGKAGAQRPSACIESLFDSVGYTLVSTGNFYRGLLIGGGSPNQPDSAEYGIVHKKTGSDFNNSEGFFQNVIATGITKDCFSFEHSQSKAHTFINCFAVGGESAVSTLTGGAFRWFGGNVSNHTVAAFRLGAPNDTVLISGLLAESCVRMLTTVGFPQSAFQVIFHGCRMSADLVHSDGYFFIYTDSGTLHICNCLIDADASPPNLPKIRYTPAGSKGLCIVENTTFGQTDSYTASPISFAGTARIIERNNSFVAASGVTERRTERGTLTLTGVATTVAQVFEIPVHDASYRLAITPITVTGSAAAGSSRVRSIAKSTTGFTVTFEAAPSGTEVVTFDWSMEW